MELLEGIYSRRSVREFTGEPLGCETLHEIVNAGTWAPSGLNNQPWRFALVSDPEIKERISTLTKYSRIIRGAAALICVYVDTEAIYHEVKDHQAMGACIQNMLLAAHTMGLGGVWLGEILKNAGTLREILELPESLDLMAVVALGRPTEKKRSSKRKALEEVIVKEL